MKTLLFSLLLMYSLVGSSQVVTAYHDAFHQTTTQVPRFLIKTERKDSLWFQQSFYIPEKKVEMEGWYKDGEAKIKHGIFSWYHRNGTLKSRGRYVNNQKEGLWVSYYATGGLNDSAHYENGRLRGVYIRFHSNGMIADSLRFDEKGNGAGISWFDNGILASAGHYTKDSLKTGRWKYFHQNGAPSAVEDYSDGIFQRRQYFAPDGKPLADTALSDREAAFGYNDRDWWNFLARNLNATAPVEKGASDGTYTVVVQFVIDTSGYPIDIESLTGFGYGMEEEVVRVIRQSPPWRPLMMAGRPLKAYRKQPITFIVEDDSGRKKRKKNN